MLLIISDGGNLAKEKHRAFSINWMQIIYFIFHLSQMQVFWER